MVAQRAHGAQREIDTASTKRRGLSSRLNPVPVRALRPLRLDLIPGDQVIQVGLNFPPAVAQAAVAVYVLYRYLAAVVADLERDFGLP